MSGRPDLGLSILFLRFSSSLEKFNQVEQKLSFQFSFWDSLYALAGYLKAREKNFQLSFWDSSSIGFRPCCIARITFNSLFEIRLKKKKGECYSGSRSLSILFLRFDAYVLMRILCHELSFQFSFWDSRLGASRGQGCGEFTFQFSFWDSDDDGYSH